MSHEQLQSLFNEWEVTPEKIRYLVNQGIELEKLKLKFFEASKNDTIESYVTIMEGERFINVLSASRFF